MLCLEFETLCVRIQMMAPRFAGCHRLFFNEKFVLSFALAVFAVLNGTMGANVIACQAVGALRAPCGAFVLNADVAQRTNLFTAPTSCAFIRRVEKANACEIAVEEGTKDVTLRPRERSWFYSFYNGIVEDVFRNAGEQFERRLHLAQFYVVGINVKPRKSDIRIGHDERES